MIVWNIALNLEGIQRWTLKLSVCHLPPTCCLLIQVLTIIQYSTLIRIIIHACSCSQHSARKVRLKIIFLSFPHNFNATDWITSVKTVCSLPYPFPYLTEKEKESWLKLKRVGYPIRWLLIEPSTTHQALITFLLPCVLLRQASRLITLLVLYSLPLIRPSSLVSGGVPAVGSIKIAHLHVYPIISSPLRYPFPTGYPLPPTMGRQCTSSPRC